MRRLSSLIKAAIISAVVLFFLSVMLIAIGGDALFMRFVANRMVSLDTAPYFASKASPVMLDRGGAMLYTFLAEDEQWRFPVSLEKISHLLIDATLATEDKRFYDHAGVDSRAVLRAVWLNVKAGHYVSGASTLTMQLVKQQSPTPRTLTGKAQQALMALRLDNAVTKEAILEAYLNTAPYGGNIVGVEAASRRYFGKSCMELTLPEAAMLTGIPKSPLAFDPLHHPEAALKRRNHVLRRMMDEGMITPDAYRNALDQPLNAAWHDYPAYAPHLAMTRREKIEEQGVMQLTLDGALQARLEELVPRYLKQFDNQISNGAIMVLNTQSGDVLARVGSADFNSTAIHGQVDICRAPRAPGSALKPFVYALALEKNLLYPTEVLLDNTLDYGIYNPVNFDGMFNGTVSAGEALRWSLNIPAVQVQGRTGVAETIAFLKTLGLDTLNRSADSYGLGLVLGNCEVRLESLMEAYLTLARLGEHTPLRLTTDPPESPPTRVLSEGVALALWNMLEQPFPEELWTNLVRIGDRTTRLCWKTGTSTGYHDAWAVAFNCHYVVGVWVGNSDGRASNRLVGAYAALPLVAQVFRSLPVPQEPDWPQREERLVETEICAATGLPSSAWCPATVTAWLPSEQYLHRRCDVHRPGNDGSVVAHWPSSPYTWDLARVPASSSPLFPEKDAEVMTDTAPVHRHKGLSIVTPANNATYILTGDAQGDRIRLNASRNSAPLHWYHNDQYLGRSEQMSPLYLDLTPGEHHIACMDDTGETASVAFTVQAG